MVSQSRAIATDSTSRFTLGTNLNESDGRHLDPLLGISIVSCGREPGSSGRTRVGPEDFLGKPSNLLRRRNLKHHRFDIVKVEKGLTCATISLI